MKTVQGTIVAVQEERFRLVSREGRGYLLTLAKHASTRTRELEDWRKGQMLVEVHYSGQPDLESGVAWEVWPLN